MFPLLHGLMRYSQDSSYFYDCQLAINARQAEMLAECPGIRWRSLLEAPIW